MRDAALEGIEAAKVVYISLPEAPSLRILTNADLHTSQPSITEHLNDFLFGVLPLLDNLRFLAVSPRTIQQPQRK